MSGGIAYVFDEKGGFEKLVNKEMVALEELTTEDKEYLQMMLVKHVDATGSKRAQFILSDFEKLVVKFAKVMPTDYKRVLEETKKEAEAAATAKAKRELQEASR
jgi:glutamate synthase domain-containing protein 3